MDVCFVNKVILSNKTLSFKELKVKHLKVIYKSVIGENIDPENIFNNLSIILSHITDLSIDEINDLNFLDYFILLFEIRCNSIGSIIFTETPEKANTKIEINIYKFIEILKNFNLKNLLISEAQNKIEVFYKLPKISDLLTVNKNSTFDSIYNFFIEGFKINNNYFSLKELSLTEQNAFLEKLPAKNTSNIIKKVQHILKELNKINLLSTTFGLDGKILPFNIGIQNLSFLVKLLFGDQLLSLYENIFALCKLGNFTPEYIENCTPGEYLLFVKKLETLNKQQSSNDSLPDYDPVNE